MNKRSFGRIIRYFRKKREMSLMDLSRATNINPSTIKRIESFNDIPTAPKIAYLAVALEADLEVLFESAKEGKIEKYADKYTKIYEDHLEVYKLAKDPIYMEKCYRMLVGKDE